MAGRTIQKAHHDQQSRIESVNKSLLVIQGSYLALPYLPRYKTVAYLDQQEFSFVIQFPIRSLPMPEESLSVVQCSICYERSTWDFLRDFYNRDDASREYISKLESDLCIATNVVEETQLAFNNCETALLESWEKLNEERLDHRASREELSFERERHKESTALLERVFGEAVRSGDIADDLRRQVASLQADLALKGWVSKVEGLPLDTALSRQSGTLHTITPTQISTEPVNPSSDSVAKPFETFCGVFLPPAEPPAKTSRATPKGRKKNKTVSIGRKPDAQK